MGVTLEGILGRSCGAVAALFSQQT